MEPPVLVYADLSGMACLVGRLWARTRSGRQSATFTYDPTWLVRSDRFALAPALKLDPGPFHAAPAQPWFGAIHDSAPDRWGRALMRRAERRRANRSGETPRTLLEIDYLLLVSDAARQGALRFARQEGGPFLANEGPPFPPLLELPRLLSAAERVAGDSETDEDLRLLLAPGSSLGGARPKASVRDRDGHLTIAKFPHPGDEIQTVRWEAVALTLAGKAGLSVPAFRVEEVGGKPILLSRRFDRERGSRLPFLSAMSMLGAHDGETRSYLELVDALRQHGARPKDDMRALWRRIVFNILISNTDDHLRNHGFLYAGTDGWRLSPAYDLNPVPTDVKPRVLATAIDLEDGTASLARAISVCEYFDLDAGAAWGIVAEVGAVAASWRDEAARLSISPSEIDRMASAFEHEDQRAALDGTPVRRGRGSP